MTATVTATTAVAGTATTDAALSSSAATTDLSVEFGAAIKYHRRTTARARPPSSAKGFGCGVRYYSFDIGLVGSLPNEGVNINGKRGRRLL
jgi:hypothetical protein